MGGGEIVDDRRLLLECVQFGVVKRVAFGGNRLEFVHQSLGLAGRDDRLHLALQALPLAGELLARVFGGFDRLREFALAGDDRGDGLAVAVDVRLRGVGRLSLREVRPAVRDLVDGRVETLQLKQVVAQHGVTR